MAHLTEGQRYKIEALCETGLTQSEIAQAIGKDKSVVYRELKRNRNEISGEYNADVTQRKCVVRHAGKRKKERFTPDVKECVEKRVRDDLCLEQIAGNAYVPRDNVCFL